MHFPYNDYPSRPASTSNEQLTWVCCFMAFMAAETDSDTSREMAAYGQIVVMQVRKHPSGGILAYNQQFRQQWAAGLDHKRNDLPLYYSCHGAPISPRDVHSLSFSRPLHRAVCLLSGTAKAPKPPACPLHYRVKPEVIPNNFVHYIVILIVSGTDVKYNYGTIINYEDNLSRVYRLRMDFKSSHTVLKTNIKTYSIFCYYCVYTVFFVNHNNAPDIKALPTINSLTN